ARTGGPLLLQRDTAAAANIDARKCAGHGIEARGIDQAVERVLALGGADARGRDLLDRSGGHTQQCHIVAVEGRVVVRINAHPLGSNRVTSRKEFGSDLWIVDDLADFRPDELGGGVIRLPAGQEIVEGTEQGKAAALPSLLKRPAALV